MDLTAGPFGHSSEPRAVQNAGLRSKYRDDADPMGPNIMFDPRVVRGSTFSQHNRDALVGTATTTVVSGGGFAFPPPAANASGPRGSGLAAARATAEAAARQKKLKWREKSIYDYRAPPGRDSALDLSVHLEEKVTAVAVASADAQTDGFEPQPADAPYVPRKTGQNASTQMDARDQPFEFDRDVAPLLAVVVRKTLEQALLEVEQDAELAAIAHALAGLEAEKSADALRVANLEARTAAKHAAKRDAVAAARAKAAREQTVREKVCAVRLMAQCWPGLRDHGTYAPLEAVGAWCSPTVRQVRGDVLPWLYSETALALQRAAVADALVADVVTQALAQQTAAAAAVLAERDDAKRAAARGGEGGGWVRIFLDGASLGLEADAVVGPIQVGGRDTIGDVEVKIAAWLEAHGILVSLPEAGFLHLALDGKQLDSASRLLDESVGDNAKLEVVLPPAE